MSNEPNTYQDKVAVITGAASGIGLALAKRAVAEGMRVVLADVEQAALDTAADTLRSLGGDVHPVQTDVSDPDAVAHLADVAWSTYGAVHLLVNNAGVAAGGMITDTPLSTWRWVLGVNLYGVIHGIHAFMPRLIAQKVPSQILNVASMAGLTSNPGMGAYNVSKHGVVTLSETLHHECAMLGYPVSVSVFCPGFIRTNLANAQRNRPAATAPAASNPGLQSVLNAAINSGIDVTVAADYAFDGLREGRFYLLSHPEMKGAIKRRLTDILDERTPKFSFDLSNSG
ncbi:MAG: NAD(P)-dependent dehydrogenase (short-subunit alcohol dehydrogenase family) [Myxococcota bacterium]